jgi:hypothetical protein
MVTGKEALAQPDGRLNAVGAVDQDWLAALGYGAKVKVYALAVASRKYPLPERSVDGSDVVFSNLSGQQNLVSRITNVSLIVLDGLFLFQRSDTLFGLGTPGRHFSPS